MEASGHPTGGDAALIGEPPREIAAGRPQVFFLEGRCHPPRRSRIRQARVTLDGRPVADAVHSMPMRGDLGAGDYWWALVPVAAVSERTHSSVGIEIVLAGGERHAFELMRLGLVPADAKAEPIAVDPDLVAICMATYNPDPELFARQIRSIQQQSYERWHCLICDDCSSAGHIEAIESVIGGDSRFTIERPASRLGVYGNFERALRLAPKDAGLIALADQDDVWHPGKIAALREALGESLLAYSDMRIVDEHGVVVSDTYWQYRNNNHTDIAALAVANTVTGAASLMRRELLDDALPFPPRLDEAYHDHWLALVALALGPISYVERPLHDYVQHGTAILGHQQANAVGVRRSQLGAGARAKEKVFSLRRRGFRPGWRALYFEWWCLVAQRAMTLERRLGDRIPADKRRALGHLRRSDSELRAFAWLAARGMRAHRRSATFGGERFLLRAALWRQLARARARLSSAQR